MKVIIIDDDAEDRQFLIDALRSVDDTLEVLEAPTCMDGLKHLDIRIAEPVDYIFLDINMPGANGKECLGIIKKNNFLKHIPVVMLSTSSYARDKEDCLNAGAFMYIVKPNSLRDLVGALDFLRQDSSYRSGTGGSSDQV
jgi:DNA-binding response OmpR family regulator